MRMTFSEIDKWFNTTIIPGLSVKEQISVTTETEIYKAMSTDEKIDVILILIGRIRF